MIITMLKNRVVLLAVKQVVVAFNVMHLMLCTNDNLQSFYNLKNNLFFDLSYCYLYYYYIYVVLLYIYIEEEEIRGSMGTYMKNTQPYNLCIFYTQC